MPEHWHAEGLPTVQPVPGVTSQTLTGYIPPDGELQLRLLHTDPSGFGQMESTQVGKHENGSPMFRLWSHAPGGPVRWRPNKLANIITGEELRGPVHVQMLDPEGNVIGFNERIFSLCTGCNLHSSRLRKQARSSGTRSQLPRL